MVSLGATDLSDQPCAVEKLTWRQAASFNLDKNREKYFSTTITKNLGICM